jgi:hypothetical protein
MQSIQTASDADRRPDSDDVDKVHRHGLDPYDSDPRTKDLTTRRDTHLSPDRPFKPAQLARIDEALTLAARGSGGAYEDDSKAVSARLGGANGLLAAAGKAVDGDARAAVRSATARHAGYVAAHTQVRRLDDGGDYDGAVDLAIGKPTSATFTGLTDDIGRALESRKAAFTDEIGRAGRGLGLLTVLGPLLALAVCAFALMGIRARLEEYR